jgi:hypothetical protein
MTIVHSSKKVSEEFVNIQESTCWGGGAILYVKSHLKIPVLQAEQVHLSSMVLYSSLVCAIYLKLMRVLGCS